MHRGSSELLSTGEVQSIHRTSMDLLANVGVEFPFEDALSEFKKHGARTDGSRVFLAEDQVLAALETVPKRFTIHARNVERSVVIGDGQPVFAPGYGAPFLIDVEVGKRVPTMQDYHDLARLAHALPNQDLSGHLLVHIGDVPACTAYLRMLQANMVHSDKPFIGSTEGLAGARHTMEMSSILFDRDVQDYPVTVGLINSLSPLSYGTDMLVALMEYACWRQPVVIAALAMAGLTAPVTLAGLLAMQNAELLAGIVLTQLVSPGMPVIYGSASTNVDLRTGKLVIGSPELGLLVAAHAQLARYYGLPSRSGGALTDASYPDAQAGFESMHSLLLAVDSGMDFVLHAAGILGSFLAFSFEKFVLDDEMCGMMRRFARGISVTPDTLAYDLIARVALDGSFLTESHTLQRCRTEFWAPAVSDRMGVEAWMVGGRMDAVARARLRWQSLLAEHEDPPLDGTTLRQLQTLVDEQIS
jgi:trimethylamine--corrinoid protein Co-methyltransferase